MKILTNQQLVKLKCDAYEDGFRHGNDMKKEVNRLWFHAVCMYINSNLIELERNTWDKGRIKRLKEYLDIKEKTFGEFITGIGEFEND